MCFGDPAKSLSLARARTTPEQWAAFEREFSVFCDIHGLPDKWAYWPTYDWARWAFWCARGISAAMPVNTGDRLTDEKANHIIARDGFKLTGVVLSKPDGARCIVEMSAVRWLTNDEMWAILHPVQPESIASAHFERIGLAMMSDEQAQMSVERFMLKGKFE